MRDAKLIRHMAPVRAQVEATVQRADADAYLVHVSGSCEYVLAHREAL